MSERLKPPMGQEGLSLTNGAEPRPEPDSGKPTVRDRRGACRNVNHGGTRNPLHNRKGAGRKLSTYRCARCISIPTSARYVLWEPAVGDCRRRPGRDYSSVILLPGAIRKWACADCACRSPTRVRPCYPVKFSKSAFASCKLAVSNPSVNQL